MNLFPQLPASNTFLGALSPSLTDLLIVQNTFWKMGMKTGERKRVGGHTERNFRRVLSAGSVTQWVERSLA